MTDGSHHHHHHSLASPTDTGADGQLSFPTPNDFEAPTLSDIFALHQAVIDAVRVEEEMLANEEAERIAAQNKVRERRGLPPLPQPTRAVLETSTTTNNSEHDTSVTTWGTLRKVASQSRGPLSCLLPSLPPLSMRAASEPVHLDDFARAFFGVNNFTDRYEAEEQRRRAATAAVDLASLSMSEGGAHGHGGGERKGGHHVGGGGHLARLAKRRRSTVLGASVSTDDSLKRTPPNALQSTKTSSSPPAAQSASASVCPPTAILNFLKALSLDVLTKGGIGDSDSAVVSYWQQVQSRVRIHRVASDANMVASPTAAAAAANKQSRKSVDLHEPDTHDRDNPFGRLHHGEPSTRARLRDLMNSRELRSAEKTLETELEKDRAAMSRMTHPGGTPGSTTPALATTSSTRHGIHQSMSAPFASFDESTSMAQSVQHLKASERAGALNMLSLRAGPQFSFVYSSVLGRSTSRRPDLLQPPEMYNLGMSVSTSPPTSGAASPHAVTLIDGPDDDPMIPPRPKRAGRTTVTGHVPSLACYAASAHGQEAWKSESTLQVKAYKASVGLRRRRAAASGAIHRPLLLTTVATQPSEYREHIQRHARPVTSTPPPSRGHRESPSKPPKGVQQQQQQREAEDDRRDGSPLLRYQTQRISARAQSLSMNSADFDLSATASTSESPKRGAPHDDAASHDGAAVDEDKRAPPPALRPVVLARKPRSARTPQPTLLTDSDAEDDLASQPREQGRSRREVIGEEYSTPLILSPYRRALSTALFTSASSSSAGGTAGGGGQQRQKQQQQQQQHQAEAVQMAMWLR